MYLSHLWINVGDNPDRPRPGRKWLKNVYHVHQRLCMGFPSDDRLAYDPDFLKPYNDQDFPETKCLSNQKKDLYNSEALKQVHAKRNDKSGFLFRIDPHPGGNVSILVLSALRPNWDYAFHNAGYLLACPPTEQRPFDTIIEEGTKYRFRLKANTTRKIKTLSKKDRLAKVEKRHGTRVPVPYEKLDDWLNRKAINGGGFRLLETPDKKTGYVYFNKPVNKGQKEKKGRLISTQFDGVLEVTDPEKFRQTLIAGIGPAKAFGFGLMSVAKLI